MPKSSPAPDVVGHIEPGDMPVPPADLSESSRRLWRDTVKEFEFGPTELALLESGCRAWDRGERARAIIEEEGMYYVTERSGVPHLHPAVRAEAEAQREFRLTWRQLGLATAQGLTGKGS